MFILSLLLLLFTAYASPQHGLVSTCVAYEIAFPNGHEAVDLTQDFCHLVEENLSGFKCADFPGLLMGTAGDFVVHVYSNQAEFCEQHKGIMTTDSADSQMLREVALAETMLTVPKDLTSSEPQGEARRRLFFDAIENYYQEWANWYYLAACESPASVQLWGSARRCSQRMGELGLITWWAYADKYGWNFDRRALQTTDVASSSFVINANSIFTECSYGLGSYICDVPLMDILNFFNTGSCARANGLICVVQQDDLLALVAPAVQP
jgi:hypothetical protein